MGDKFSKATGLTFAAFVALIVGLNWQDFFAGLSGLPAMVRALSEGMPYGFWSTLLAFALACGIWGAIFIHPSVCKFRPHTCADTAAVVTGLGVNIVQYWTGGHGAPSSAWLLGLLAGLGAMYSSRLLWSFFAPPKEPPA